MKILFVSLGCDKNLVDTEHMIGSLAGRELPGSGGAYTFTDNEDEAEIAVVNTCAFIDAAKEESIEAILSLAQRRQSGQLKALIVAGCLAQRFKEEVLTELPEVDAVIGTTAADQLPAVLEKVLSSSYSAEPSEKPACFESLRKAPDLSGKRTLTTGGGYGYLKIAEGCSKCCSYCVIPSIRGPFRSVPMEKLIQEAEQLAGEGVKELILVAQETTVYGTDLYGEKKLPELLRRLCRIEGFEWIRILYCYPEEITQELIQVMKEEPKILHYLDMPIQHASDAILQKMHRRTSKAELIEVITHLREEIPDICLRTTLITGFPTEDEKQHKELLAFVRKMKFDRLGVFTYSREDGTLAAKLKPQVGARVKKARQKEIMLLQQEIAFKKAARMKGKKLRVMIEGRIADQGGVYTARSYRDAPGVDGLVFVESDRTFLSGDFVTVRVTGAQGYDLIAREA
ncbi:MAG: 30S ribosomal protein S12 methylthiotransferase RimO [Lachnospiraceae bacterium]|nr:30S ribosomal protein S12 methylthiotransferase RimO [Lachnospiraceae bacterium]